VAQSDRYLSEVLGPVQHKLERSALEGLKMTTAETALLARRPFIETFRATAQEVGTGECSTHNLDEWAGSPSLTQVGWRLLNGAGSVVETAQMCETRSNQNPGLAYLGGRGDAAWPPVTMCCGDR
jgi:hypothetical protein